MEIEFSVDLISDLNLDKSDIFDWTGNATSLFCCIAGNISDDTNVIKNVLEHLSTMYRGVFYIDGYKEHNNLRDNESRIKEIVDICEPIKNVIYLHNHVVVLNGHAFIGINGWYTNKSKVDSLEDLIHLENIRNEDLGYLSTTIKNLQLHSDVKKLVIISSCIPNENVLYNHESSFTTEGIEPALSLVMDVDKKVSHWLYGGTEVISDSFFNKRRFVNNPRIKGQPYYPKRIVL